MKPAVFDYYAPESLDESLSLLEEHGFDSKILSGGQSLIPMMNMRLARPKVLIDINKLNELSYIDVREDCIEIGGLTRQHFVEENEEIRKKCPFLIEGIKYVGHSQIRSRGTIGGSIVHADPTAELPVILTTLGGTVTVQSTDGKRDIEPDELFLTYMTTTLDPEEILISVNIPLPKGRSGQAIEEFTLRSGDFAIVNAACNVQLNDNNEVSEAILVLGGVDGVPVVLDEVTDELIGQTPNLDMIEKSTKQIVDLIDPEDDIHASSEYRTDLAITLSNRVLIKAIKRAKEKE